MPDESDLPVDPNEPMAIQSRRSLMLAEALGLLTYRTPIDMTSVAQLAAIRGELGDDVLLPDDKRGVYYLAYVHADQGARIPVLLAEGEARAFVFGLAVARGSQTALRVLYRRSLLPA